MEMQWLRTIISRLQKRTKQLLQWPTLFPLKKIIVYFLMIFIVGYGLGFLLYQHLFYLVFTRYYNRRKIASHVWIYRRILGESGRRYSQQYQIKLDWMIKQPTELWHINNQENIELHAQFLRGSPSPQNRVAVLAHGFRGNPLQLAHFVDFYRNKMGCHVLLPIARGHGSSGGEVISFGYKEQEDYTLWLTEVLKEFGSNTDIILHGVSMGGATVLLTGTSKKLPPQVKAIVSDSSFSSLHAALAHQFPTPLGGLGRWILSATNHRLKSQAHFSLEDIDLLNTIANIPVPVLFVHGTKDRIIPESMANSLYDACPHPKKYKLSVDDAGHAFSWFISPCLYASTLKQFLQEALDPCPSNDPSSSLSVDLNPDPSFSLPTPSESAEVRGEKI